MQNSYNKKILELNPAHPLIKQLLEKITLAQASDSAAGLDEEGLDMLHVLTHGALIHSGYQLENPLDFQTRLFRQVSALAGVEKGSKVEEMELNMDDEEEEEEAKLITEDLIPEGDEQDNVE